MAAGEDKDSGDPIARAIQRKAEADAQRKTAARPSAGSGVFYEPLPGEKTEPTVFTPDESSFFAPSADERAEQARRAAQRVRRRARGEEVDVPPAPRAAAPRAAAPKVEPPAPEPSAPKAPAAPRESLMDRAMGRSAPAPEQPKPDPVLSARQKPAAPAKPIMDRAIETPPPSRPKKPVLTKAERRLAEKNTPPAPAPTPPPEPKAPVDLIARSAEQAAEPAQPKADPAVAAKSVAPSLMQRLAGPAKAKRTKTVEAAPAKRKVAKTTSRPTPPPISAPGPQDAPAAAPVLAAEASIDPLEAAYIEAEAAPAASPMARDVESPMVVPTSGLKTARTRAFAAFEWMIAGRYLRARKKEGFVSVITGFSLVGIALGVATLIVVMAVMTGFRETLITQIVGGSPHINVMSQSDRFENYDALAEQVRGVPGVDYVTPIVQGQVLGTGRRGHSGVIVRGMRKADLEHLIASAEPEVTNGSLAEFTDNTVAVGANLAARLGLRVGDYITLISPDGDITPFSATPMPRTKDYRIIYTFRLGVQEIDYGVAFMPFDEAQIYFNKQGVADTLDVFVDDPQSVSDSLANLQPGSYEDEIFAASRTSISINNWKNTNGRLIGAINLERQVMFVILTMIILVASLNIISGLVMLVKDKARDVAIMRTMGMARGSILRIFFICGSSIGVVGSVAGVILGVLFVWNIHAVQGGVEYLTGTSVWDPSVRAGITEIPTKLQLSDVALTLFIALGLSFIATLFPAWKAAKLDPVEALRYE